MYICVRRAGAGTLTLTLTPTLTLTLTPTLTLTLALTAQEQLTPWSKAVLLSLPPFIRQQLLLESTASDDSAQLGQIETERLLADLVRANL
jgi:hypothetical protein